MPSDNQYMDSTNSDVFQTLAQQNAQAMQGRGGGGGGGVADIILGQNNDYRNNEAAKDRDMQRMLDMQQTQDARSQHQKNLDLDRDKEVMEFQADRANQAALKLQLQEIKRSQIEEDAAGPINEESNRLTDELNNITRQSIAAAAAHEKSQNQTTNGVIQSTNLLKQSVNAKDIFLSAYDANLKLKGNLSSYAIGNDRENAEVSNHVLSAIAHKMGTDFSEKRSAISGIGSGLARLGEGAIEFFTGPDNVANAQIASTYESNPELEGLYASAFQWQNGSLKKTMDQSGHTLYGFSKNDEEQTTPAFGDYAARDKNTQSLSNKLELDTFQPQAAQKFTSDFLADSYISLLRNSNFSVTTDQAKKEVADFFTTLQQKSSGVVETKEQLEKNKSELAPQISQLSQSLFGGPGHEPEVVETLLAAMKGFRADAVNLSGAVRAKGSDTIDPKSLMIAGFSNALAVGGKLESWLKGHTLGSYMTREGVNLALGNLNKSGSDYNAALLDPETIKGLQTTPEGQQIIDLMKKGVEGEKARKSDVAKSTDEFTRATENLKNTQRKAPAARTASREQQKAELTAQLKALAKKTAR